MRPSDRFESLLWLLAVVMLLVAIPVAGAVGTSSYSGAGERIRAERSRLTPVTATVQESPTHTMTIGPRGYVVEQYAAPVAWSEAGRSGTAVVDTPASTSVGDTVVVWLSSDGRQVEAPGGPGSAASAGISAGLLTLGGIAGGALVIAWAGCLLLDQRRRATWAREWARIDRATGKEFS